MNSQDGIRETISPKFRLVRMVSKTKKNIKNLGWGAAYHALRNGVENLQKPPVCIMHVESRKKCCGSGICGNNILNNPILNKYFSRDTLYIIHLFEKFVSDTHYIKHIL